MVQSNGLSAFIIPVMISRSKRVSEETIKFLFEFLFSQTVIHKDFDFENTDFPKVLIMFTNFTRYNKDPEELESSDSDDNTPNEEWFDKIISAVQTQLAMRITLLIHQFKFDFNNLYKQIDQQVDQEQYQKVLTYLQKFILPKENFFT